MFTRVPLGKLCLLHLFYGKETHVGEPMKGMTANYIASFLTQRMEWNELFRETDLGETTPLPVSLQQKDLKLAILDANALPCSCTYIMFFL